MPDYNYEAINSSGQKTNGTLTAVSEREVLAMLDSKALFPVRIAMARGTSVQARSNKKVKARQTAAFFSQLADLLRSGVPLLRSLEILEKQQTSQVVLQEIIRDVHAQVADGTTLYDALAK
ncbi:MAG TPA: type II secretion system F family protein, partial [Gemmataceae bacterium]|nr:type II secretion system F family protein [Gemmataceae bacterium]